MPSANIVILIGRLGDKTKTYETSKGKPMGRNRLAVNSSYRSGSKWQTRTDWVPLVFFYENLITKTQHEDSKGKMVYVEGKLQTDSTKKPDGSYSNYWSVVVQKLQVLSGVDKSAASAVASGEEGYVESYEEATSGDDDVPF